jgi:hypothetical protein
VYLARDADRAVVLRRGPARWVRAILWDTARDTFEGGQWFHGRIYEDKCDLSPDGQLFIYFAAKHGVRRTNEIGDIWTAVSKPPYFTALALWPQGGTYGGGGFFLERNRLVLRTCGDDLARGFSLGPLILETGRFDIDARREKNGWSAVEILKNRCVRWAKPHPRLPVRIEHVPNENTYVLVDQQPSPLCAEWADFDRRGRLVFTSQGKLHATTWDRRGKPTTKELADFSAERFASIEAPAWAQRW